MNRWETAVTSVTFLQRCLPHCPMFTIRRLLSTPSARFRDSHCYRSKFQVRGGLMLVLSTTIVGSGFRATLTRTTYLQSLLVVCELLLTNFFILTVSSRVESYNILLRVHFHARVFEGRWDDEQRFVCTTLAVLIWSSSAQQTSS